MTPLRTSSTSQCNVKACLRDPTVQRLRERIAEVTRVPWEYAEHLQLLRYESGQFCAPSSATPTVRDRQDAPPT